MISSDQSDFELLEAWREGSREAGAALFNRHFKALYRFFRNKAGDDADDLIQQTFLACIKARDRFRGDASFRTYLFAAARHKLYDHFARRKPTRGEPVGLTSVADQSQSLHGALVRREDSKLLLLALRRLPLDYQVALELHYFEGMRGPQLAQILDIPEGTVRSRLRLGRKRLRTELERLVEAERVETTMSGLEDWAASIRAELGLLST